MLKARFKKHTLIFKRPSGTSRGVLSSKDSWFIFLSNENEPTIVGIGECSLIPGLSPDILQLFEIELNTLCQNIENYAHWIETRSMLFPAISFGLETAIIDLAEGGKHFFGNTDFTNGTAGIPTNGLVWMGNPEFMKLQIREKLKKGFTCIKIKVGAISFADEIDVIQTIRKEYSHQHIELRLDANGAFSPEDALEKLKRLSEFGIQSIEQPIKPKQFELMSQLCLQSPIPIALDEELIAIDESNQADLLRQIKPAYIILKPSLLGGIKNSNNWANIAESLGIGWWFTSALESNIGLNAIAQWTFKTQNPLTHGLGTGELFTNNIGSPLELSNGKLFYYPEKKWKTDKIAR